MRVGIPGQEHYWGCLGSWLPQLFTIAFVRHLSLPILGQHCRIRGAILNIASHENTPKEFDQPHIAREPSDGVLIKFH